MMKQAAINALGLVMFDIMVATEAIRRGTDSIRYWQNDLYRSLALKAKIEKRFKVSQNVILVDFSERRKVA
jgi:hypothetical protein